MMPTRVRCACVDIGSNTTRLLVADVVPAGGTPALRSVSVQRSFLGLPEGALGGTVGPQRAARLAAVVASHVALAREHRAERIRIVGTAALRRCADRDEVVATVTRVAGLPVTVLGPEEEARLAFAGATLGVDADREALVGVADVGGGSAELVVGTLARGVGWSASVPTGSGVLAAAHLHSDPPTAGELRAAAGAADAALGELRPPRPELALAVGGSAASVRRLAGVELGTKALDLALRRVCAAPAAQVAAQLGLHVERVRLLPGGLLLLRAAADALGQPLRVAGGGLREGVVLGEVTRPPAG
jgi:exopolyphosphatase/guanosine-5'-triphosphate,3'-diphosphate pyrophosphatase